MSKEANTRLTKEEFVLRAIDVLVNQPGSKSKTGIHSRMSGFNEAFRKYFDGACPIEQTTQMRRAGIIAIFPSRGGVMMYRRESISEKYLLRHDKMHADFEKKSAVSKGKTVLYSADDALSAMNQ